MMCPVFISTLSQENLNFNPLLKAKDFFIELLFSKFEIILIYGILYHAELFSALNFLILKKYSIVIYKIIAILAIH